MLGSFNHLTSIYYSAQFGSHRYCRNADIRFIFVTWPRDQKVTWLGMWSLLMVSYTLPSLMTIVMVEVFLFVTWPHNKKVMSLWKWGSLTVSYFSANFGDHRYCRRADIRLYICHVTTWSKGHLTWWMLSVKKYHHPL